MQIALSSLKGAVFVHLLQDTDWFLRSKSGHIQSMVAGLQEIYVTLLDALQGNVSLSPPPPFVFAERVPLGSKQLLSAVHRSASTAAHHMQSAVFKQNTFCPWKFRAPLELELPHLVVVLLLALGSGLCRLLFLVGVAVGSVVGREVVPLDVNVRVDANAARGAL
jgi:hypothetical protein